ncbi:hypothetical protein Mgra_00003036 [Meloidogyne graminicola]|uniref:Uncharacterized protein n=1 Tax=Meloidogyne graminicola TaxID=189291 RepID=A0A8S9ZW77_9BILA|nr:hypothetical protein Mgra_00003036 [Meloidogyne graminicola]
MHLIIIQFILLISFYNCYLIDVGSNIELNLENYNKDDSVNNKQQMDSDNNKTEHILKQYNETNNNETSILKCNLGTKMLVGGIVPFNCTTQKYCFRFTTKVNIIDNAKIITYGCNEFADIACIPLNNKCGEAKFENNEGELCCCNTDYCNFATGMKNNLLLILLLLS